MKDLRLLEKKIGITFKNKKLLENALIHRSYLNEHKDSSLPSNEKLEFLGDSVLSLITSMYLYSHYPEFKEGDYTEIKSSIVKTESLANAANELNLGEHLYLSKGEEAGKGRNNKNMLADSFEALLASIFIDKGFDKAYDFIVQYLFKGTLDEIIQTKQYHSAKSQLQEFVQARMKTTPVYRTIKEEGPEHDRVFTIAVLIQDKQMGIGRGASKKSAEEKAAFKALEKLR